MDSVNVTQIVAYVEEDPVLGLVLFSVGNVLATSICPFPLGVVGCVIAGVLYGAVLGAVIYVLTCSTGAWITFVLVRLMRPHLIARLGPYARTWERLDAAITREGVVICMLWRVAPIAPFVLSSVLISMTGLTQVRAVASTRFPIPCPHPPLPHLLPASSVPCRPDSSNTCGRPLLA